MLALVQNPLRIYYHPSSFQIADRCGHKFWLPPSHTECIVSLLCDFCQIHCEL